MASYYEYPYLRYVFMHAKNDTEASIIASAFFDDEVIVWETNRVPDIIYDIIYN